MNHPFLDNPYRMAISFDGPIIVDLWGHRKAEAIGVGWYILRNLGPAITQEFDRRLKTGNLSHWPTGVTGVELKYKSARLIRELKKVGQYNMPLKAYWFPPEAFK